jgi:hypothetical protein
MSMRILAIDPNYERSAMVIYDSASRTILWSAIRDNIDALFVCSMPSAPSAPLSADQLVVEMVSSYGMPVGKEVFETVYWIGRFMQAWPRGEESRDRIFRADVKMHLCHSMRAKDSNIRAALLDRFGPGRQKAIGTKKSPGPLYGIKEDLWSALAVAVTYADKNQRSSE